MSITEIQHRQTSGTDSAAAPRLRELVAHLAQHRTQLREEWVHRIAEARLLMRDRPTDLWSEQRVAEQLIRTHATWQDDAFVLVARCSERLS